MNRLTYVEKVIAQKTMCILLLQGTMSDGQGVYAYVAVQVDRMPELIKAQLQPDFKPQDYGAVLASGIGEPPQQVREHMEREYGFDHARHLPLSAEDFDKM